MAHLRYIEALDCDDWKSLSRRFNAWLTENATLTGFGYSEGDELLVGERRFLCFAFPSRHMSQLHFFDSWAASTGRLYGHVEGDVVRFPSNPTLVAKATKTEGARVPPDRKSTRLNSSHV